MFSGLKIWFTSLLSWGLLVLTYFFISLGFDTETEIGIALLIVAPPTSLGICALLFRWVFGKELWSHLKGNFPNIVFLIFMLATFVASLHSAFVISSHGTSINFDQLEAGISDLSVSIDKIGKSIDDQDFEFHRLSGKMSETISEIRNLSLSHQQQEEDIKDISLRLYGIQSDLDDLKLRLRVR